MRRILALGIFLSVTAFAMSAFGQEHVESVSELKQEEERLAEKLQNPVAALISVPLQNNFDFGAGPNDDGFQWKLNIQPVIPFSLTKDWNLIVRAILPVISQNDVAGTTASPSGAQTGLGDTLVSLFFSPQKPGPGGIIWGAGPALYFPTGTDRLLGAEKWGAGPTAVILKQAKGFTFGLLANHVWSFAGAGDRNNFSNTFMQPFFAYTTKASTTFSINSETSYDWKSDQWTVPINAAVSQLVKIKGQFVNFQLGGRIYPKKPAMGPDWGLRFSVTFLFPKSKPEKEGEE